MAKPEGITEEKLTDVRSDLSDAVSLLQAICDDLLPVKISNGTFDGIDVAMQLAARRAGQLVESAAIALGDVGFTDEPWLPGPKSLGQAVGDGGQAAAIAYRDRQKG